MMHRGTMRMQHAAVLLVALVLTLGSWAAYADTLPHFKCYQLAEKDGALNEEVTLITQFSEEDVDVKNPHFLCAPTTKIRCPDDKKYPCEETKADLDGLHLLCWKIAPSGPPVNEEVEVFDQFAEYGQEVKVQTGQLLCAPAIKKVPDKK